MSMLFYVSYAALWILLVATALLLLLLYRHFGLMALGTVEGVQRDGLPLGEEAPPLSGVTSDGKNVQWSPLHGPKVLLFGAPGCGPCAKILPYFNALQGLHRDLDMTVFVAGPAQNAEALMAKYDLSTRCIADDGSDAFGRFRVRVSPFGFVLGADGRIRSKGLCSDAVRFRELLSSGGLENVAHSLDRLASDRTKPLVEMTGHLRG
ncbi:MAG TPA: TlpA disulfide reductase family protein [Candidatus Dormibacteraeota bacterium]|nr:TlpA disulfide reductase family protein [Candidatus Dormibacteraeota bacterium]